VRADPGHGDDDAARGADDGDVAVLEAGVGERRRDGLAHGGNRRVEHVRRHLLDADLERERLPCVAEFGCGGRRFGLLDGLGDVGRRRGRLRQLTHA